MRGASLACLLLAGAAAPAPPEVRVEGWSREACVRPPCAADAATGAVRVRARLVVARAPVDAQCGSLLDAALRDPQGRSYPVERIALAAPDEAWAADPATAPRTEWIAASLVRANADVLCPAALAQGRAEALFPVPSGSEGPFEVSLLPPPPSLPAASAAPVAPAPAAPEPRTPVGPAAPAESLEAARRQAADRASADYRAGYTAGRAAGTGSVDGFCWLGAGLCAPPCATIGAAALPADPPGHPPRGSDAWRTGWEHGARAAAFEARLKYLAGGAAAFVVLGTIVALAYAAD